MPRWVGVYALLAVVWGGAFAVMKLSLVSFTPVGVSVGRLLLAAATVVLVSLVTRTPFPPRSLWKPLIITAFLAATLPWFLLAFAQTYISSSLTAIMASAIPLFTLVIILCAFPEETPTPERIIGLIIGFLGVLVVSGAWSGLGSATWIGMGVCVVANVVWAASLPYSRRHLTGGPHASDLSPLALSTGMLVFAAALGLPFAAFLPLLSGPVVGSAVVSLVVLGCVSSGIGYLLNFRLLGLADATTASTITYATPVVAVVIGTVFLGEHLTWNEPVGGLLILCGAAVAQGLVSWPRKQGAT